MHSQPLTEGGIGHAIVGTLWMIGIAVVLTVPIGLVAAVYLDMTRSRPARTFRTMVEAMSALPSILAGLFIYAPGSSPSGFEHSGLAAALALSVMMLPYMIRASDLALRLVPGSLREASAALGAPSWRGELQVVIPTARSGLATAVILGIARGIGEASPGAADRRLHQDINANPLHGPMASLPLTALKLVQTGQPELHRPGLRRRVVPPAAGHRPLRHRPEDRRMGPRPPVRPRPAPCARGLGPRRSPATSGGW